MAVYTWLKSAASAANARLWRFSDVPQCPLFYRFRATADVKRRDPRRSN